MGHRIWVDLYLIATDFEKIWKNKQQHWARASFALLIFVILGYVIRFYPQQLTGFDSTIQSAIRGDLPATLTAFFTKVTHVMDTKIIVIWVGLLLAVLPIRSGTVRPSSLGAIWY